MTISTFPLVLNEHTTLISGYRPSDLPTGYLPSLLVDWKSVLPIPSDHPGSTPKLIPSKDISASRRWVVILHAFHVAGIRELLMKITRSCDADLVVTTDTDVKRQEIKELLAGLLPDSQRHHSCHTLPNRGRDVLPFWQCLAEDPLVRKADFFIKLHPKVSPYLQREVPRHGFLGDDWVSHVLDCLMPGGTLPVGQLAGLMDAEDIGLVMPTPPAPLSLYGWGRSSTFEIAKGICTDLMLDEKFLALPLMFPAGNMMIGKATLFRDYASYFSDPSRYPAEPIDEDGTFLHAVERIYALMALSNRQQIAVALPSCQRHSLRLAVPVFDQRLQLHACTLAQCLLLQNRCAEREAQNIRRWWSQQLSPGLKTLLKQRLIRLFRR